MSFLDELAAKGTLRRAWESVAANRGVAGIDRVSVADFGADLERNLDALRDAVRSRSYRPLPVLRIRPAFLKAADRALVVPAVGDRVVQRAIADLLRPQVEPTLSPACRAFRKGFSATAAADDVGRWVEGGTPWVMRADVERFFDSIRREVLLEKLRPFVDGDGLRFLERILRCRIFDHHLVSEMVVGIAQGSPLSPLLGNLYLADVDLALLADYPQTIRYCDDLIVLAPSEAEAQVANDRLAALLEPLGLNLNQDKTRICRAEDGFVFLGYHFGAAGRGPAVKAVEALGCRLEQLAGAAETDLKALDAVYRGWTNYFGDHPESWMGSPAGILALLRAGGAAGGGSDDLLPELAAARWRRPFDVTPALALELAREWAQAERRDQSWLEMAISCGGSKTGGSKTGTGLEVWADVLGVPSEGLAALARQLKGAPKERLAGLTEGVAELGDYEAARRLAAEGPTLLAAEAKTPERSLADLATGADFRLLNDFFQGREGVYAEQTLHHGRHRAFLPVHRPITDEDWRDHLSGEKNLALPLVRAGNTALVGVLDVDVAKRALDDRLGVAEELLGRALATALRLRRELERRGCTSLLEVSGYKGYHVWVRLEEAVPCFRLRRFLLDVVRAVSPLPEAIRVEEFPSRDRVRPDVVGPLIKLPLGVHAKTGRRSDLLDARGRPLADPFEALRSLPRLAAAVVCEKRPARRAPAAAEPGEEKRSEIGPRARRLLEGCRVLAYLARRAEETAYLNHRERYTLLCTLGHLGDEGKAALHAIIGHTYNYRRQVTARHVKRLPGSPMSCPKVRELHPGALADGGCDCQFALRGRGYPTPVLHVLKPSEVAAFRKPAKVGGKGASRRPPARDRVAEVRRRCEEKVRKIAELNRHRRGLDASVARIKRELAALFDEAGVDVLETATGTLRRRRDSDDAPSRMSLAKWAKQKGRWGEVVSQ